MRAKFPLPVRLEVARRALSGESPTELSRIYGCHPRSAMRWAASLGDNSPTLDLDVGVTPVVAGDMVETPLWQVDPGDVARSRRSRSTPTKTGSQAASKIGAQCSA